MLNIGKCQRPVGSHSSFGRRNRFHADAEVLRFATGKPGFENGTLARLYHGQAGNRTALVSRPKRDLIQRD
jgi:hypothetical protein